MGRWNNKPVSPAEENKSGRWAKQNGIAVKKVDEMYGRFAEMMIKKIESFQGSWKKPWFTEGCHLPRSIYGKSYSGMNAMMLSLLCEKEHYKIPVFATAGHIDALNYKDNKIGKERVTDAEGKERPFVHILKGSKSFPVFLSSAMFRHMETGKKISYRDYLDLSKEQQEDYEVRRFSRVYPVFNIDQTNIREARPEMYAKLQEEFSPKVSESAEQIHIPVLDNFINDGGWLCPIKSEYQDNAFYSPSKDYIQLPTREQFQINGDNGEEYYGNMLHEVSHSTGHSSRLNRLGVNGEAGNEDDEHKNTYGREELVAECTSAIWMLRLGHSKYIDKDSVGYLQNWLDSLKADPDYIHKVMSDVKAASNMIYEQYVRVEKLIKDEGHDKKLVGGDLDGDGIIESSEIDYDNTESTEENVRHVVRR